MRCEFIDASSASEESARVFLAFDVDDEGAGDGSLGKDHEDQSLTIGAQDSRLWDRQDETPACAKILGLLSHDFIDKVPGQ